MWSGEQRRKEGDVKMKLKKQEVGHDTVSVSKQSRHVLVYGTGLRNKENVTFLSFVLLLKKTKCTSHAGKQ